MVGAAGSKEYDGTKKQFLDVFDGSNAGDYRRWRRRAELYLRGLATTVPEKKRGARRLEHLSGEAEELMEHLPLEKIIKDGVRRFHPRRVELLKETIRSGETLPRRGNSGMSCCHTKGTTLEGISWCFLRTQIAT